MLKTGTWILSGWCLLNMLPGVGSLFFIAMGNHAPGLRMHFLPEEIPTIESRALATIDGIAVIANALIAVYGATAFFLVRTCLAKGHRRSFFVLAGGTAVLQVASYVSDSIFFGGKNLVVINVSSLLLVVGLGLSASNVFKISTHPEMR